MDSDEAFVSEEEEEDSGAESGEDEADDIGIGLSIVSEDQHQRDSDGFHYSCLEPAEIVEYMCDMIREVTNIVQIPPTTCRMLLHHFEWNKEKLVEKYYDGDREKLFKDVGVVSPFNRMTPSTSGIGRYISGPGQSSLIAPVSGLPAEEVCGICLEACPTLKMAGLECGHKFCPSCWARYLTIKIMEQGEGQGIRCSATDCRILVDDATAMKLISDPKVKRRYQQLITDSFVEWNKLLRWCPTPDCGCAIKVNHFDAKAVTCRCSATFCFGCGRDWHDPVTCLILEKWTKKCNDDSETSNWIAANTKECPKCKVTIEKDGGCNHMTCKNVSCKAEFCWICLGPWEPHGNQWYACNRYNDESAKLARDAQEKSRAALQRYLHYCNRYMNHMQSMKFENKLYATVKTKMEQIQQHNMSWIEVQFLKNAVDVLCRCRRTLMYTYVFAYYLVKNNQSIIFENNQEDLELATEQLSEFLERDLEKENLTSLKQKVQDKYRYCENRCKILLDHCHEGDEKDWWEYTV